jgi:putative ABC transport system ATP-binding protein
MELLAGLNRDRGITIVMVTHEAPIARYASRTIDFVDGQIRQQAEQETV